MPMKLIAPMVPRERILAFGNFGTGKSEAPLTMARAMPDAHFHVLDTDFSESYEVALESTYADLSNMTVHKLDGGNWTEMIRVLDAVKAEVGRDDWLVFDSMTPTWDAVQGNFIERVYDKGIDEYFLEVRMKKEGQKEATGKGKKSLGALEGWMDWPVINKMYATLYGKLTSVQGHLYMTAEQAGIGEDDDADTRKLFGSYGVKPKGQKRLGFIPRTVLLMSKNRVGEYYMTTVKDRQRVEVEDVEVGSFAEDYLVKIGGWKKRPYKVQDEVGITEVD